MLQSATSEAIPCRSLVVYIGGYGRSGSTLISRVLGQLPDYCDVGELTYLWDRGVLADESCGCGEAFSRCDFWNEVMRVAFGSNTKRRAQDLSRLRRRVARHRHIPLLIAEHCKVVGPQFEAMASEYRDTMATVYAAIRSTTGARVIVDSSKEAGYAYLINGIKSIDLRILHLVRDSRAVAYSWQRTVRRPEAMALEYFPKFSALSSATQWMYHNLSFHGLRALNSRYSRLRYEDMVGDFPSALANTLQVLDDDGADRLREMFTDGMPPLRTTHDVSGNPMRFQRGPIVVQADDEWRSRTSWRSASIVSALTWPLLRAYEYNIGWSPRLGVR